MGVRVASARAGGERQHETILSVLMNLQIHYIKNNHVMCWFACVTHVWGDTHQSIFVTSRGRIFGAVRTHRRY